MSILFFAGCIGCILYCTLYGLYSLAEKHILQAVSLFVMAALGAGAVTVLMLAA